MKQQLEENDAYPVAAYLQLLVLSVSSSSPLWLVSEVHTFAFCPGMCREAVGTKGQEVSVLPLLLKLPEV